MIPPIKAIPFFTFFGSLAKTVNLDNGSLDIIGIHRVSSDIHGGDIINFDVTVYLNGAFGDCSAMVCVGDVDPAARFLVDATKQCLDEAVELVGPGAVAPGGFPVRDR